MILKSLYLKEGLFERKIEFSNGINLIHSDYNSCGKTTLLCFILYALGYSIPSTKKIKFQNCEVELIIQNDKEEIIKLVRNELNIIQVTIESVSSIYILPEQQNELHSMLYNTCNIDILSNILGAYYVDQEKGWTLLNRGVVIGSIHFNIEQLIRGLSGADCSELLNIESKLSRELSKYKQMFSVAQYQEELKKDDGSVIQDSYEDIIDTELDKLIIIQKQIKKELKRIDNTLNDNKRFKTFIADMKLLVTIPDGSTMQVTEDKIVGLNDSIELLITKKKTICNQLADITAKIGKLQVERDKEYEQLEFFRSATQIEVFDKRISRMPLNAVAVKQEITKIEKQIKSIREEITMVTKKSDSIVPDLSKTIIKYASELGVGNEKSISSMYLFTSNLKELSGAVLHKTVFAFRLGYITALEKELNIKLPIILDSPSGKEVDNKNIQLMMDILKRDFSDHQIIIASIFDYDFKNVNIIKIHDHLINQNVK